MPSTKRKHAKVPSEIVIPEKIYFRIGEVSELASLPTYVLRFWETEFPQLKPTKSSTGQRMYRRKDVEFVMRIRRLLYEDGFTIAGAREKMKEEARGARPAAKAAAAAASEHPAPMVVKSLHLAKADPAQPTLPFFETGTNAASKAELQRLRQQLSDVLALLT